MMRSLAKNEDLGGQQGQEQRQGLDASIWALKSANRFTGFTYPQGSEVGMVLNCCKSNRW